VAAQGDDGLLRRVEADVAVEDIEPIRLLGLRVHIRPMRAARHCAASHNVV
jgi:hypothetical protein